MDRALEVVEVCIGGVILLGLLFLFVGGEFFFIYLFRFWPFLVKSFISFLCNIMQLSILDGETVRHRCG